MSSRLLYIVLFLALSLSFRGLSQLVVNHHVDFTVEEANMWGPTFGAFTLDQEITIFEQSWNTGWDTGSSGIVTLAGQSFGAAFSGNFSGLIGSKITIQGFTSGDIDIDYPVDIELTMPNHSSYDQGDNVTIQTDYTVTDPGWALETHYPAAGEFFWDLYFQMAANATATLCAFGCTSFPIIPSFNTGLFTLNLMAISTTGASTDGNIGVWYLGPGALPPYIGGTNPDPCCPGTQPPYGDLWPYAVPPSSGSFGSNWIPWQVHIPVDPTINIPDNPLGLTGGLTIPYVETDDVLTGQNIQACGDSTYFNMQLEIFDLLGTIIGEIPCPQCEAIGFALENLSASYELPGGLGEVSWTFFTAYFEMTITNKQCFDFTPKVYGSFEFPLAVDYTVFNPSGGVVSTGQSSVINVQIGNDLQYKYPCYYEDLWITPTYTIDGQIRNHTWDEIQFSFNMGAFAFALEIPPITVIPAFTIPEVCVDIPYPCPTWSNPFKICWENVCTPEINVPCVCFPGFSLIVPGPTTSDYLWSYSIPIGPPIPYDWFDQTWSVPGFNSDTKPPFIMTANQLGISNTFTDVACNGGSTGSITVNTSAVSPAYPYTYTWTNGTITSVSTSSSILNNLPAGPYEVSVIDANGCQMFTGATIEEPQPLVVNYIKNDKSCGGGVNDGSITTTVTGGTAPYSYSWNTGSTAPNLSNLNAGTYNLTVTDSKLCTYSISVTINEPAILSQTATISDVNCFTGNDGAIDVTTYGGTLPYSFSWSSGQSLEDISDLTAGTYTLTVTDVNNCTNAVSYIVNQPATAVSLTAVVTDVSCKGGSDGIIDVTTSGGTPGYYYQWSNSVGVLPYVSEDITNMLADNYSVTVTDSKGCQFTLSETINEPAASISSTPILVDILCYGDATGSIDPGIAGGTSPYSYSWSTGATSATLTGITAGTYDLQVTDSKLCVENYSYTLVQPDAPLDLILTGTDVDCFGASTGSVVSEVTGGTGNYAYSWSNGATSPSIYNVVSGTYDLTVTDENACTINGSMIINQPAAPLALSSVITDVDCYGNNTGAIDMTIVGGTGPYTQFWYNSATIILSDTTADISNQYADAYTIVVVDANGCSDSLVSTIGQPAEPLIITGIIDDVNCYGFNDGSIDITVTGGTTGYTFNWSNGATTEDISNVVADTYTIDITDLNGCTASSEFIVDQPVAPLDVTTIVDDVKCFGETNGSIISQVTGGTMPYSYTWSNSETTPNISLLPAGVYTLTVTDDQGCTAFTGAVVNEPAQLVVTPTITDASCYGYADGEVVLSITGGVQPYYFTWGNADQIMLNNPSETLSNLVASNYLARVVDANGCMVEQIVIVGEPEPFIPSHIVTDVLCYNGTDGAIDLSVIGGTTPYTYSWNSGQTTEDIANIPSGDYIVMITDAQGCVVRDTAFVDQPDELGIWYEIETASCIDQNDGNIEVSPWGGIPPYTYVWSNGSTQLDPGGLTPGDYMLILTDDHLCTDSFNFYVAINYEECLEVPNTFTPNGDNYNDTWILGNIELYPNATIKVFNKWGNEVFASYANYADAPWDGTFKGNPLPSEVYYYIIILNNPENNQYTGNVTIVR